MPEPTLAQPPEPPERPPGEERRGYVRYHYRSAPALRYQVRASFEAGWAVLRDISAGGVGLLLSERLAPGSVVLIRLGDSLPEGAQTRLARVVHATARRSGAWLVGCEFTPPLSEEELAAIRLQLGPSE
jgi:c-di-GMP-binding flagellar brake protein YcgR